MQLELGRSTMKKLIILGALAVAIFLPSLAFAQLQSCAGQTNCTAVTATITDANGNVYANCSANIQFSNSPAPPAGQTYQFNGSPINPDYIKAKNPHCDANGVLKTNLVANGAVLPAGTTWTFNITAQDGVTTFSSTQTISPTGSVDTLRSHARMTFASHPMDSSSAAIPAALSSR